MLVFLVCGPIIPIRMGSPSFEAKFQLSGKTEQANAETFMSIPGERRTRMERTLPANPSKVTIGIITPWIVIPGNGLCVCVYFWVLCQREANLIRNLIHSYSVGQFYNFRTNFKPTSITNSVFAMMFLISGPGRELIISLWKWLILTADSFPVRFYALWPPSIFCHLCQVKIQPWSKKCEEEKQ